MEATKPVPVPNARYLHEVLFAVFIGFVVTNLVLWAGPQPLVSLLLKTDRSIRVRLAMPVNDVGRMDFIFSLCSLALAICTWSLLRFFSSTRMTQALLRTGSGIAALGMLPALLLFGNPSWWRYEVDCFLRN